MTIPTKLLHEIITTIENKLKTTKDKEEQAFLIGNLNMLIAFIPNKNNEINLCTNYQASRKAYLAARGVEVRQITMEELWQE